MAAKVIVIPKGTEVWALPDVAYDNRRHHYGHQEWLNLVAELDNGNFTMLMRLSNEWEWAHKFETKVDWTTDEYAIWEPAGDEDYKKLIGNYYVIRLHTKGWFAFVVQSRYVLE